MLEPLESLAHVRDLKDRHRAARAALDASLGTLTAAEGDMARALAAGTDPGPTRKSTIRHREAVAQQEAEIAALAEAARLATTAALEAARLEVGAKRLKLHSQMDEQAHRAEVAVLELARAHRAMIRLFGASDRIGKAFRAAYPNESPGTVPCTARAKEVMTMMGDAMNVRTVWVTAKKMEQAAPLESTA